MKKSDAYYLAQISVVESSSFDAETVLEILPVLMEAYRNAWY